MRHVFFAIGVLLVASVAVAVAGQPAEYKLCDLSVLYIRRTPRYPGHLVEYYLKGKEGLPQLVRLNKKGKRVALTPDEIKAIKHWPDEGEAITYTAVIENKGTVPAHPFEYKWCVDGKVVDSGKTKEPLAPGKRTKLVYKRPWKKQRNKVELWIDPMRRVRQFSYSNDRRSVWTHAKFLICLVDKVTYESFAKNRNFLGTYNFEDWCQAHADWMNLLFKRSVYPGVAPKGILERVAIDRIVILEDRKALDAFWKDGPPVYQGWDGAWWFGPNPNCARWASVMDWGLIHEWGHQFGLTDLYVLDVAGECNQVLDKAGSPLLIGRISPFSNTMMCGHGPVIFSADQAVALNHQLWRRRGYYGDYYYNLSAKNYIRITDSAGKPVPDTKLRLWQRKEHLFKGSPDITGRTDKTGKFLLPNRPAPNVKTYGYPQTGYEQRDNPFGQIHVVGVNGVFLVEITARGQTDYKFFDITQMNLACARSNKKAATLTLATPLPVKGAPPAPPAPKLEVNRTQVTLRLPGVKEWTVMRADPGKYIWKSIGKVTNGKAYVDRLSHGGLYRYAAAVVKNGKTSTRSQHIGVAIMRGARGLAVGPDGTCYVRVIGNGQTLMIRPDGVAVGYVGSCHWHLEGSYDHAIDAAGQLYILRWPERAPTQCCFLRKVDPKGKGRQRDHTDLIAGYGKDTNKQNRFKKPMGVWVSPKGIRVVIADTGNDRVHILDGHGKVTPNGIVAGLNKPQKALLAGNRLVVCDTGAKRVAIFEYTDNGWKKTASLGGFEKPIYCCLGAKGKVWIADNGLGRIIAVDAVKGKKTGWMFPVKDKAKLADVRGIAYDAKRGDLLYIDGKAERLVRQSVK